MASPSSSRLHLRWPGHISITVSVHIACIVATFMYLAVLCHAEKLYDEGCYSGAAAQFLETSIVCERNVAPLSSSTSGKSGLQPSVAKSAPISHEGDTIENLTEEWIRLSRALGRAVFSSAKRRARKTFTAFPTTHAMRSQMEKVKEVCKGRSYHAKNSVQATLQAAASKSRSLIRDFSNSIKDSIDKTLEPDADDATSRRQQTDTNTDISSALRDVVVDGILKLQNISISITAIRGTTLLRIRNEKRFGQFVSSSLRSGQEKSKLTMAAMRKSLSTKVDSFATRIGRCDSRIDIARIQRFQRKFIHKWRNSVYGKAWRNARRRAADICSNIATVFAKDADLRCRMRTYTMAVRKQSQRTARKGQACFAYVLQVGTNITSSIKAEAARKYATLHEGAPTDIFVSIRQKASGLRDFYERSTDSLAVLGYQYLVAYQDAANVGLVKVFDLWRAFLWYLRAALLVVLLCAGTWLFTHTAAIMSTIFTLTTCMFRLCSQLIGLVHDSVVYASSVKLIPSSEDLSASSEMSLPPRHNLDEMRYEELLETNSRTPRKPRTGRRDRYVSDCSSTRRVSELRLIYESPEGLRNK